MVAPGYHRETIDALVSGLRAELATRTEVADVRVELAGIRVELAATEGRLRTDMAGLEGRLTARIDRLQGEWKVWLLVLGAVLAVVSSGVGARMLALMWPDQGRVAPGATAPYRP